MSTEIKCVRGGGSAPPAGRGWQVSGYEQPLGPPKNSQRSTPAEIIHELPPNDIKRVAEEKSCWVKKKKEEEEKRGLQPELEVHLQVGSSPSASHRLRSAFFFFFFTNVAALQQWQTSVAEKIELTQDS